ncbi:MAG: acyl-CoA dehydratase activase, partial [Spirochaetales bacterium]|nr:acyl-CoA dehydratase activase [Spirochaetales bacterium]MCF7939536.1 acyl-CoA dehydratase activase [Spirochaetales bacterium]
MILGLDIGSVAVGCVLVDNTGKVLETEYRFHEGKPRRVLEELLLQSNFRDARSIGVTATSPEIIRADLYPDPRTAYASGARRFFPDLSTLLVVGGERFERIHFDERGRYRGLKSNTSCAAGTGSFLDQQAVRLGLADSGELSDRALEARTAPNIASRCSVFAKTDLIHAQQEGYSLEAICYGLCRGLARNIYDVLFGGEPGEGPVVFAGGVSKNEAVRRTLEELIGRPVDSHPQGHLFGALGAALETKTALESTPENRMPANEESAAVPPVERIIPESKDREYSFEPLTLQNSEYPDFSGRVSRYCCEVEVEEYQRKADLQGPGKARPAEVPVFLGIDVGSTSTKAILTAGDEEQSGDPLFGFYTRTGGDPLDAIGRIFQAIRDTEASQELRFDVRSAGSTGSGRTFIGNIIGADLILDEITAHARAACSLKPETDTIIEIGGQDAKFTTLKDGNVTFSQMNSVCAAGTGSFLEEQAARVGIGITDFAQLAENVSAPLASDRCTVFMERDINHLVNRGYSVREVLAAAVHSVTENYLQKVADEAAVGSHIVFQGATAKNRALVAAFEQRLDRPITVSPYCHLTGALGAAILAAEEAAELRPEASSFRGFDLDLSAVSVRTETCDLCTNHCRITIASIG